MEKKKSLKGLWIAIAATALAALGTYLVYTAVKDKSVNSVFGLTALLTGIFVVTVLGYLLGRVTIKGVSLGTAGVFLVAILFGFVCSLKGMKDIPVLKDFFMNSSSATAKYYKSVVSNLGLVLFVSSVGFIAGPSFFKDLKRNFKTYILMGFALILTGVGTSLLFCFLSPYGSDFWSGILSGALTSTPGYSAAIDATKLKGISDTYVTVGYAIAYPFGVIGVVLFVQLLPKFLKADMAQERTFLTIQVKEVRSDGKKLFTCDNFGFTALAIAIVCGLLLGGVKIPLPGGANFSLGTTGGVLISSLVFGHFGKIGKLSMQIPAQTTKVLKELGLMLFLIGAGVVGGVELVAAVDGNAGILIWGFLGGAAITLSPMIVGYFLGKKVLKIPLLNNLGSITGGMTSTPALGTLISTAQTEDVAGAYASTYPIALVLIVLACNLMIGLI